MLFVEDRLEVDKGTFFLGKLEQVSESRLKQKASFVSMQWQKRNKKSWQSMACCPAQPPGCFTTLKPQGALHNELSFFLI